jgi:hypothetical protein
MSLTELLVPTYCQLLERLADWLAKAEAARTDHDAEGLISARLAPDMFPLATQVRFACVQAWEGVARLQGAEFPPEVAILLEEGRAAETSPGTIAEARARIAQTVAMLASLAPDALYGDPHRPIAHALPMGIVFDFTAEQYARDWALPQFYFHVMTAYAILRHAGVNLGKADYVAHLFAHVRPGTMPHGPG